jgi:3-hydroxyisobutyrate dehydrogenase-like beta-hydroxyacid dehydrogenase
MQIGMIGLGRMGANMVRRLLEGSHECVVFDRVATAVDELAREKAVGASSLADLVSKLKAPRAIWMMIPGAFVEQVIADLLPHSSRATSSSTAATPTTSMTFGSPGNSRPGRSTTSIAGRAVASWGWSAATA